MTPAESPECPASRQRPAGRLIPSVEVPNLRVLWIADHLGYGGATIHGGTTYHMNVLPRLQQSGVQVIPCFLRREHPAAALLRARGVEPLFFNRRMWSPWAFPDLVRLVRRRRVTLMHASGMKSILLTRFASRTMGVPVVTHFHDSNRTGPLTESLLRGSARWDAASLAISAAVRHFAVDTLGCDAKNIQVLYNCLETRPRAPGRPSERERVRCEFGIPPDAPLIGVVGRFSREKGHAQFLEALPGLLREMPDVKVLLVGDGVLRGRCEQLARTLHLEHATRFAGFRNDVPAILEAVDLVAIPSLEEGLSFAALEAMTAGRPLVATAVGGLPEIVRHGETGLLARGGDMPGMMQAMKLVLTDVALRDRLVAGGMELARSLSVEAHVSALLGLYERVLQEHSRALRGT
jgi:glycosyltransferase involved in cell wall biosynthesis